MNASPWETRTKFERTWWDPRIAELTLVVCLAVVLGVNYADRYWIPEPPEPRLVEKESMEWLAPPIPYDLFVPIELHEGPLHGISIDGVDGEAAIHIGPGWDCDILFGQADGADQCLNVTEDGILYITEYSDGIQR